MVPVPAVCAHENSKIAAYYTWSQSIYCCCFGSRASSDDYYHSSNCWHWYSILLDHFGCWCSCTSGSCGFQLRRCSRHQLLWCLLLATTEYCIASKDLPRDAAKMGYTEVNIDLSALWRQTPASSGGSWGKITNNQFPVVIAFCSFVNLDSIRQSTWS